MVLPVAMTHRAMGPMLLAVLLVAPAAAQTNTWTMLSPPSSTRRFPANFVDCSPTVVSKNPVSRSYSSVINGPSGKLLYWGGGHATHPGNDAEIFDTATQTWTEQFVPECLDACCRVCSSHTNQTCITAATCPSGDSCPSIACGTGSGRCAVGGVNGNGCSCIIASGAGTTSATPHNRPYVEHVYQAYAYNANASRRHYLFSLTSGAWSYSPPDTWVLLTTSQAPLLDNSPWSSGKLVVYDPTVTCGSDTGAILLFEKRPTAGIYCFNYGTNAWDAFDTSATALPSALTGYELTSTWDSTRSEHIISDSDQGIWRYKASTKAWTNTNAPAGAIQTVSNFLSTAVAYDPVHDITLALKPIDGAPSDMWQYNNATGVWSDIDDSQLGTRPAGNAEWNVLRYDNGTFYFLSGTAWGTNGQGGTPDSLNYGSNTWAFQWSNPPTITRTSSAPLTWAQRATQPGVLAAIGFHNSTEVNTYSYGCSYTGLRAQYDPAMNAARFPVINSNRDGAGNVLSGPSGTMTTYDMLDNVNSAAWSGAISYSLPWAQQFDENSEFEVQYTLRDDDWVTEHTTKKNAIWSAGDRVDAIPAPSGHYAPLISDSCLPNDVVISNGEDIGLPPTSHVGWLSGYQGCSSGPAWGLSRSQQIGVDFNDFSPPRNEYWYQPAIPSCMYHRIRDNELGVCTVTGANVWQTVTLHVKLGPRGLCNGYCSGDGPWANFPRWQSNHAYVQGDKITDSNGNIQSVYYSATGTSGGTEPTWPTAGGGGPTADGPTLRWTFYGGKRDWFTNSYLWVAFGWEGHPSTALIYRGPFSYYSPISFTLDYGDPPPKIGKIWLFPYRQSAFDTVRVSAMSRNTFAVTGADLLQTYPAGAAVTDGFGGYTTLTADAHYNDNTIQVADTSSFTHGPYSSVRVWQVLKAGARWYKDLIIATGSTLSDPHGTAPIVWPVPPNNAAAFPGLTAPPSGQVPTSGAATRPAPPVLLP